MFSPVVVSLPVDSRRRSFDFYRQALELEAIGPLADDGLPEPLQFVLNEGLRLMLIPEKGFGWVIGSSEVAPRGHSEAFLTLAAESDTSVNEMIERAQRAGAELVYAPGPSWWGYAGAFADPDGHMWMVRSEAAAGE